MKQRYGLHALCTLLYATSAYANILPSSLFYYVPFENDPSLRVMSLFFIGILSLSIQALLFRHYLKNISYFEGFFFAFLSQVVCYFPLIWLPSLYNDFFNMILSPLQNILTSLAPHYWLTLSLEALILATINSIIILIAVAIAKMRSDLYTRPDFEFPPLREVFIPIFLGNVITYALLIMLKIAIGS